MPKESFEQFVKKQKEKLDKAEKMVEGVKEEWKVEIEGYERIPEKLSEKIEEVFEKEKKKLDKSSLLSAKEVYPFIQKEILPKIPKIPPSLLEKTLQKVIKRYEEREYHTGDFGRFLSALINRTVEEYIESQEKKGKKFEEIEPLEIHLDVRKLPKKLDYLGYENQEKSHLFIKGDVDSQAGMNMKGGKVVVEGNVTGIWTGEHMKGGQLEIKGVKGESIYFNTSAFSPNNRGTIILKGVKIWEKGKFTKEGEEMRKQGEFL